LAMGIYDEGRSIEFWDTNRTTDLKLCEGLSYFNIKCNPKYLKIVCEVKEGELFVLFKCTVDN